MIASPIRSSSIAIMKRRLRSGHVTHHYAPAPSTASTLAVNRHATSQRIVGVSSLWPNYEEVRHYDFTSRSRKFPPQRGSTIWYVAVPVRRSLNDRCCGLNCCQTSEEYPCICEACGFGLII